jgi:V8-like Glu-specific endopeptidase
MKALIARRTVKSVALCLASLAVPACAGIAAPDRDQASGSQPVVFGTDNRIEYGAIRDGNQRRLADATAALFDLSAVNCANGSDGGGKADACTLSTSPYRVGATPTGSRPLCQGVPFRNQPTGAFCTAFLIAPDLLATAGHCVCNFGVGAGCPVCTGVRVVYGFNADASGQTVATTIPSSDVYTCTGSPTGVYTDTEDWAVMRMDRVVSNRIPLIVQYAGALVDGELAVIGHPDGLPLKFARDGWIRANDASDQVNFGSSADAFAGNSGSPVVNLLTGVAMGIHVRRPYAHYVDAPEGDGGMCAQVNTCSAATGCNPNYGTPWAAETRMTWAATQGQVPLHPALIAIIEGSGA